MASTSMMTTQVKGKTIAEALGLKQMFIDFLTKETAPASGLGEFAGLRWRKEIPPAIEVRNAGMACFRRGIEALCGIKVVALSSSLEEAVGLARRSHGWLGTAVIPSL